MKIDNFETWFEVKKVISGKSEEMEILKELFRECWENSSESVIENDSEEMEILQKAVYDLEYNNENLEDEVENMKGCIIELQNIVEESKTLKEAKQKVSDYSW